MNELLDKRRRIKKKKPDFIMQSAHKKSRLEQKWKRPRGIDSKMRLNLKGHQKCVEVGYRSPRAVRGLDKSGLLSIRVSELKSLEKINKEKEGVIISSKVGKKKKIDIINKAKELGITIINIKQPEEYIKAVEESMKKRKEEKSKKEKKKADKKVKEQTKEKKQDNLADKITNEEEKAAAEKKEKDKLLTKKEV